MQRVRLTKGGIVCLLATLFWTAPLDAAAIAVRFAEGVTHGFLVLRSQKGRAVLATGELLQVPRGDRVESRLVFRFADGSLHDETVVFSQREVFTLLAYRQVQRGPSFPETLEVSMDRGKGQYTVRYRKENRLEELHTGRLELPPDAYNGMFATLLKNLPRGGQETVHMVAFTPKPRVLKVQLMPAGESPVLIGGAERQATRYLLKPELGGLLGVVASLIGKDPPDLHYWLLSGEAPAFLKFEGPLYAAGPSWRVELTSPRWPSGGDTP